MKAVVYCRISEDREGTRVKVDRQERECRALARRLGMQVTKVFVDNDTSATNSRIRPAFEDLLSSNPEAILTWHQDRLLRLTRDLERVISLNVPVYTVTAGTLDLSTPAGRAVARTVAAWSQYEGEQKAVRQHAAFKERAEAGHWHFSRRPYGYERVDSRVEVVESEAEIVREGFRRYLRGESYYAIAEDWNARDVPTHSGKPWSLPRVRHLLRNPAYAGIREYKETVDGRVVTQPVGGDWEPLIDRETWEQYLRMRDRRKVPHDWSNAARHLGSGLYRCGVCEAPMFARPDRGVLKYACTANWCTSRRAAELDEFVELLIIRKLQAPEIVRQLRDQPDTTSSEATAKDLRGRRDHLAELAAEGLLSRDAVREQASALTAKIEAIERTVASLRARSPLTDLALSDDVPGRWSTLGIAEKRFVLDALMTVRVHRTTRGRLKKDPDGKLLLDTSTIEVAWQ